uniref:hypothetical protein n=1 Tax=Pseudomonas aeruginosa TaxID=287 RepID=UPI0015EFB1C1|nr:hypothetical protein [Pseudomonas aeruginosa]
MSKAEEFIAQDFVYAGRRLLKSGKMGGEVFVVTGSALGERMLFDYRTLKGKAVGGIYRGASFSADQVRDLSKASYQGQWADDGVWGAMEPKTNVSPTNAFRCLLPRRPSRQNSCACRPPG